VQEKKYSLSVTGEGFSEKYNSDTQHWFFVYPSKDTVLHTVPNRQIKNIIGLNDLVIFLHSRYFEPTSVLLSKVKESF
jgi:hypothetical protein